MAAWILVLILCLILLLAFAFIIASMVLFVLDGSTSKKENRPRKVGITVMFIISIVLLLLSVISGVVIVFFAIMYVGSTF